MQVTKMGKDPKTKVHHGRCGNCSTEVEFKCDDPEVRTVPSPDPRDQGLFELHYDCPTCGKDCYVFDQR